ncbi:MAG: sortase [Candidatus Daviesbacteria bacterium]|nr:MAG: sortase [Candidatus Daviesbacteria bacterium]
MSTYYKLVLFVRFLGYFSLLTGLLALLFILGPLGLAEARYRSDQLLGVKRTLPKIIKSDQTQATTSATPLPKVSLTPLSIDPIDTNFGIVIEKINANSKVIADVSPTDERQYGRALLQGVAHAQGTAYPGQKGNIYLFSHSTDAPWNIIRFNAVFYLLRELEPGDRVVMFYQNKRYDYLVYDKRVVSSTDVSFLTNQYDQSVLTLQTCDPPGTLINRLIIRAKLEE